MKRKLEVDDDCVITHVRPCQRRKLGQRSFRPVNAQKRTSVPSCFPFLRLPAGKTSCLHNVTPIDRSLELRNHIYEIAGADAASVRLKLEWKPHSINPPHQNTHIGFMQVSHQIRQEFRPILLREQRVVICPNQLPNYLEDFVDPQSEPKDSTHILFGHGGRAIDLLALGKVAITRPLNFSHECYETDFWWFKHLMQRASRWYSLMDTLGVDAMSSEYRLNPNSTRGVHYLFIDFEVYHSLRHTLPCRKDTAQCRQDLTWKIIEAMDLDQLNDISTPTVRAEFDDGGAVFWTRHDVGLWCPAVYEWNSPEQIRKISYPFYPATWMNAAGRILPGFLRYVVGTNTVLNECTDSCRRPSLNDYIVKGQKRLELE